MIQDPYIGMPIIMGGKCGTAPAKPEKPPQSSNQRQDSEMSGGASRDASGSGMSSGEASGGTSESANVSGFDAMYLGSLPIAMAYTPMQQWKTTYSLEKGLAQGTIFPELDLPFEGRTLLSEQGKGGQS